MMRFFFYGTLCDADVLRLVLGYAPEPRQLANAKLAGYRRFRAAGQSFPIILPSIGTCTDGLLFAPRSEEDELRLSAYEGPDYHCVELPVQSLAPRKPGPELARVYLPAPGRLKASPLAWRLDQWQAQEKPRYLAGLRHQGMNPPPQTRQAKARQAKA